MRKLASIQKVWAIELIAGADNIELAKVLGWQCVVKKGDFKVGDLGVYFEIDSIPPDMPAYQFLWKSKEGSECDRPAKFRIRTMKLRGALSQGLLMPLSSIVDQAKLEEGLDLTVMLGVEKYDLPVSMNGFTMFNFPHFVPKTDEARVQSFPEVMEEMRNRPYEITLKYDGTSATFCLGDEDEMLCCSRNYAVEEGENVYWDITKKYNIEQILRSNYSIAIQGEICGPGIQKNRLGSKSPELFIFGVYDIKEQRYFSPPELRQFCQDNNLPCVEVIARGNRFSQTQESLLQLAEGFYPGTKNDREGIVIRPREPFYSKALSGPMSFKAISNRFLLKSK